MPITVFPAPSGGTSYSSQPPASASSVLLDGQLVTASSITTSVTGTGAPWLLYANGSSTTTFTVGANNYTVTAGSTVGTSAFTGSQSVSVSTTAPAPTPFTSMTMPDSTVAWGDVTYGSGKFVATGSNVLTSTFLGGYSTNGISWSLTGTLPNYSTSFWRGLSNGNGTFITLGGNGGGITTYGVYSTNGTSWTQMTLPGSYITYNKSAYGTISGTGYFVIISSGSTAGGYSTNGYTWTASTMPSSQYWASVTYGNGTFVAVALSANGAYSTNGTSWTTNTMNSTAVNWTAIGYGNGIFVAAATNSTTGGYSSNGVTFSAMTMPSASGWNSISYGGGYFVAVQSSGTTAFAYSTNGTTWTTGTMPSSDYWNGSAYGNGTFVALNANSNNATSAYFKLIPNPVAYGIYNGATVRA